MTTNEHRLTATCGNCGDPMKPCPCGGPCGKTHCFGCDDIEFLHAATNEPMNGGA